MLRGYKTNRYSYRGEGSIYTYKQEQKCGHIITKVAWAQAYNEWPSYTTIHKGTNMRPNTQKLFKCDYNYQSLTATLAMLDILRLIGVTHGSTIKLFNCNVLISLLVCLCGCVNVLKT